MNLNNIKESGPLLSLSLYSKRYHRTPDGQKNTEKNPLCQCLCHLSPLIRKTNRKKYFWAGKAQNTTLDLNTQSPVPHSACNKSWSRCSWNDNFCLVWLFCPGINHWPQKTRSLMTLCPQSGRFWAAWVPLAWKSPPKRDKRCRGNRRGTESSLGCSYQTRTSHGIKMHLLSPNLRPRLDLHWSKMTL